MPTKNHLPSAGTMKTPTDKLNKVEVVFIDDDQNLLASLTFLAAHKIVKTYQNPHQFLSEASHYSPHTKIFIDNNFTHLPEKGTEILAQLVLLGFQHLYLLTGESFADTELPPHVKLIMKTDIEQLVASLDQA